MFSTVCLWVFELQLWIGIWIFLHFIHLYITSNVVIIDAFLSFFLSFFGSHFLEEYISDIKDNVHVWKVLEKVFSQKCTQSIFLWLDMYDSRTVRLVHYARMRHSQSMCRSWWLLQLLYGYTLLDGEILFYEFVYNPLYKSYSRFSFDSFDWNSNF